MSITKTQDEVFYGKSHLVTNNALLVTNNKLLVTNKNGLSHRKTFYDQFGGRKVKEILSTQKFHTLDFSVPIFLQGM